MKIISILFSILLLAGMAWGHEQLCPNPKCDDKICECQNIKGHCPHCGEKGIKFMEINFIGDECKEHQLPTRKQENGWTNCRADCGEEVCTTMVCDQKYIDVCGLTVYRCPYGHIFWNKE